MIGDILWPAVFAYAIWRFAPIAERFAPPPPIKTPDLVAVPEDIMAWAMGEQESWAQEEHLQVAREKFLQLGEDWNRVRRALGIGVIA
jgi:hypothetical protein